MKYFTVILSFLLIQEGQLSVSGKRMWTSTDYQLRGLIKKKKQADKQKKQQKTILNGYKKW